MTRKKLIRSWGERGRHWKKGDSYSRPSKRQGDGRRKKVYVDITGGERMPRGESDKKAVATGGDRKYKRHGEK